MSTNNIISSNPDYKYNNEVASHTNAYLSPLITSLCRKYKAERILDLGCGNGALAKDLTIAGFQVVGCDPSESGIFHARKAVPEPKFYQLGIYDDPAQIAENNFDTVISTEVVEHLFYPRYLPRFADAKLKSDGFMGWRSHQILVTPHPNNPSSSRRVSIRAIHWVQSCAVFVEKHGHCWP